MMSKLYFLFSLLIVSSAAQAQQLFQHPLIPFLGHQAYEMGITNGNVLPYTGLGHAYLLRAQHTLFARASGIGLGPQPNRPNGFGRLGLTDFSGRNSWLSLAGSHRGHMDVGALSRISGNRWYNTLGVSWQGIRQKRDVNGDDFRDIPQSDQLFIKEHWQMNRNGWRIQLGGMYYRLKEKGGQLDQQQPPSTPDGKLYQLRDDVEHWALNWGNKWNLMGNDIHQLQWTTSIRGHHQTSQFGKRTFRGDEKRFESALVYRFLGTQHHLSGGFQYSHQEIKQSLSAVEDQRRPGLAGLFVFHDWIIGNQWLLKTGSNLDYHQELQWQWSPSLRLDFQPGGEWQVAVYGGRDYRVPNVLAENRRLAFSSRTWVAEAVSAEKIWYTGLALKSEYIQTRIAQLSAKAVYNYRIYREGSVVDVVSNPAAVQLYPLAGPARQHQLMVGAISQFNEINLRLGLHYQYQDAWQTTRSGRQVIPFMSQHRCWLSAKYQWEISNKANYAVRMNVGIQSPQFLPAVPSHQSPWLNQMDFYIERSARFFASNRTRYHLFLGGENVLNQRQISPITGADQPFGEDFDGAMAWGNPQGARLLAGLRFSW